MDIFCLDKAFVTAGIEVVNAGMYCPKCKESFEEGTRRFCPTDGARLISEIDVSARQKERGIFANLIPKIDATSDFDQALSDPPRFVISESDETTSDPTDLGKADIKLPSFWAATKTVWHISQMTRSLRTKRLWFVF